MSTSVDELNFDEYMEKAMPGVTRASFEKGFRDFGPVQPLLKLIDTRAMDTLFRIVDEHLRYDISARAIDRRQWGQDYDRWLKLLDGADDKVAELETFVRSFDQARSPRTASGARAMLKQVRAFRGRMDRLFFQKEYQVRASRSVVERLYVKRAVYELTLDLDGFTVYNFPKLKTKDRQVILAAAMAGARMYTKTELEKSDVVARIPQQVSRAKRYYTKYYLDVGEIRVVSYLGASRRGKKQPKQT